MKRVSAALLDEVERREVARALRWIGIHSEAEEAASGHSKRAVSVRQEIAGVLHSITDGTEPLFGERLDRALSYLADMCLTAEVQSQAEYWTTRGVHPAGAEVLATSRKEAVVDVLAALNTLSRARPYADHIRPLAEAERSEGL